MRLFLKNLLFTLIVPGTVAGLVPWLIVRDESIPSTLNIVIAVVLFTLGGGIYLWCVWDFASFGRGTPAPIDEPKKLVVRGLYRYTRNPMYVGVLTVVLGWAVLYQSSGVLLYAVGAAVVVNLFIRYYEEPHLSAVFGEEYERYRSRVGRWLPSRRR